jgi:hypothetical protein
MRAASSGSLRIIEMPVLKFSALRMTEARPIARLPHSAAAEPAAYHDLLGILPLLQLEKAFYGSGKFLRKRFNRTLNDTGGFRLALGEEGVQFLLGKLAGRNISEWVLVNVA